jgi:carnitine O-acetyltransferase
VPLPTVSDSCALFLDWCGPLLSETDLDATRHAAGLFASDPVTGQVQADLAAYDKRDDVESWLDEFWRDRYLGRRDRIALNANFFFLFNDDAGSGDQGAGPGGTGGPGPVDTGSGGTVPDAADERQIARAARLTAASIAHKLALDAETVPPVTRRGTPLSMAQHRYLFGTTRIPGEIRDGVRAPYGASLAPVLAGPASGKPVPGEVPPGPEGAPGDRHILVFSRGAVFAVDVIGPDGAAYSLDELASVLREVAAASARAGTGQRTGALTSKARPGWARSRAALLAADSGNQGVLDVVEAALFCVALEDEEPSGAAVPSRAAVPAGPEASPRTAERCKRLLAGDPGNRWFDKGVTFIVFPDGSAGINGEHCLLDGTTIVEFIDAVLTSPLAEQPVNPGRAGGGTAPAGGPAGTALSTDAPYAGAEPSWRPVEFTLTPELIADIESAARDYRHYDEATATRALTFPGFGSNEVKRLGVSPDAFAQLAFQLAHRRAKGITGATYESIATRTWLGGRTEAMRVVTPEMVDFVDAMDDPAADSGARVAALRRAAAAHVARAKQCQAGDAPEQHLWELQLLAKRTGLDWSPVLHGSPGWRIVRDDYLSTSAAPSVNIQYFGFGATSEHCIGVAYVLLPERFNVHLSTPSSVGEQMTVFGDRLADALIEMSELLHVELLLCGTTRPSPRRPRPRPPSLRRPRQKRPRPIPLRRISATSTHVPTREGTSRSWPDSTTRSRGRHCRSCVPSWRRPTGTGSRAPCSTCAAPTASTPRSCSPTGILRRWPAGTPAGKWRRCPRTNWPRPTASAMRQAARASRSWAWTPPPRRSATPPGPGCWPGAGRRTWRGTIPRRNSPPGSPTWAW